MPCNLAAGGVGGAAAGGAFHGKSHLSDGGHSVAGAFAVQSGQRAVGLADGAAAHAAQRAERAFAAMGKR